MEICKNYIKDNFIYRIKINKIIFYIFFANVILSIGIYYEGSGWTPLIYEDLLILIPVIQRKRKIFIAGFLGILIAVTKVLFLIFHLALPILVSFLAVKITLVIAFLAFIFAVHSVILIFKEFFFSLIFLLVITFNYYFLDKAILNDRLVSSFTPHFLSTYIDSKKNILSTNPVFPLIKENIVNKKGTILIVWESLGVPLDDSLLESINKLELEIVEQIDWEGGSTISAEKRFLCNSNSSITNIDCLPKFTNNSYALHGNTLAYFNRVDLYNQLGFSNLIGKKSLLESKGINCAYAYNAICDDSLLAEIFVIAKKNSCSGLFYALTIDSHFPYPKYKQHDIDLYEDLKRFLLKAKLFKKENPNCDIFVVGDHPPPLASTFSKSKILFIKI